jgi:hypothetical protein
MAAPAADLHRPAEDHAGDHEATVIALAQYGVAAVAAEEGKGLVQRSSSAFPCQQTLEFLRRWIRKPAQIQTDALRRQMRAAMGTNPIREDFGKRCLTHGAIRLGAFGCNKT